jgi:hypothetical protein
MSNKAELSLKARIAKAKEAEQRANTAILKDLLKGNERFVTINDARKKCNRMLRECESYIDPKGVAKHKAREQAKIDAAHARIALLDEKAEVARAAQPALESHIAVIDEAVLAMGASLRDNIDSVSFDDEEALVAMANEAVEAANFQDVPEVVDPFTQYRASNRANADDEETSDEE